MSAPLIITVFLAYENRISVLALIDCERNSAAVVERHTTSIRPAVKSDSSILKSACVECSGMTNRRVKQGKPVELQNWKRDLGRTSPRWPKLHCECWCSLLPQ